MEPDVCACCYLRFAPERFSPTDKRPAVCEACVKHIGKAEVRDRDHVAAWRSEYGSMRRHYEGRITNMLTSREAIEAELARTKLDLQQAVDLLSTQYFDAPIGALRNAIETDVAQKEHAKTEAAYRTRSTAMGVIWHIDRLHNTQDVKERGKCKCGLPEDRCGVLKVLEPFTQMLDRWEDQEKERHRDGRPHGLPSDHPLVIAERRAYGAWKTGRQT